MAESCAIAFGRYLRMLRERKGLSLEDVASLSKTFVDPLHKSYLSRAENGKHRLALSKLAPVSRIYEVPPDVILERLELDMELEKLGGPETAGLTYGELSESAQTAFERGLRWESYAYFRDAVFVASNSPLFGRMRDHREQVLCAGMNFGASAMNLGRFRLAIHELTIVQSIDGLSDKYLPILLQRLSRAYFLTNELDKAREYADRAIEMGLSSGTSDYLGYFYSNRAVIAEKDGEVDRAIALQQDAFEAFRTSAQDAESARALLNLANYYLTAGRVRSARRALVSAERFASALSQDRVRALVRVILGKIEASEGASREAMSHWREASNIAKRLNDRSLRFKAELLLYKQALALGETLAARAMERRLLKIAAWLTADEDEVREFRTIIAAQPPRKRKRVAVAQRINKSHRNPQSA